jgi:hypothetical protein
VFIDEISRGTNEVLPALQRKDFAQGEERVKGQGKPVLVRNHEARKEAHGPRRKKGGPEGSEEAGQEAEGNFNVHGLQQEAGVGLPQKDQEKGGNREETVK